MGLDRHALGRFVAEGCARVTFARLIARLEAPHGRVLSFVPFVVFAVLLVTSRTLRARPAMLVPTSFFIAVVISQLPVVLLDADDIPRHALLASVSVNYLALSLLLLCGIAGGRSYPERPDRRRRAACPPAEG